MDQAVRSFFANGGTCAVILLAPESSGDPEPNVDLQPLDRRQWHHPGVVDQDIDALERFDRGSDQADQIITPNYVGRHGDCLAPRILDRGRDRFNSVSAAGAQYHARALRSEMPRSGLAHAARCAGDDDDFAFDAIHFGNLV